MQREDIGIKANLQSACCVLVRAGHQYLHTSGCAVLCCAGNQLSLRQLASSRQPDIDQVTCRVYIHQLIAVALGQMVTCVIAQWSHCHDFIGWHIMVCSGSQPPANVKLGNVK